MPSFVFSILVPLVPVELLPIEPPVNVVFPSISINSTLGIRGGPLTCGKAVHPNRISKNAFISTADEYAVKYW